MGSIKDNTKVTKLRDGKKTEELPNRKESNIEERLRGRNSLFRTEKSSRRK